MLFYYILYLQNSLLRTMAPIFNVSQYEMLTSGVLCMGGVKFSGACLTDGSVNISKEVFAG
jgi:hypothetical protein